MDRYRHPRCGATWTGLLTCHCAACCATFSAPSLFDQHRSAAGNGSCLDPAELTGMEFRDGMWRGPERAPEERERLAAVTAERAAERAARRNGTR